MKAIRSLRCERCGAPDPDHPDSAKYGGVTVVRNGEDWLCEVCVDVLVRETHNLGKPMDSLQDASDAAQTALSEF